MEKERDTQSVDILNLAEIQPAARVLIHEALHHIELFHSDKEYHNLHHTKAVMRRCLMFLECVKSSNPELVSDREMELGLIAAAHHDVIQESHEENGMRVYHRGENELLSAQEAVKAMQKMHTIDGSPIYSDDEISLVSEAILHTVPEWSSEYGTMIQPKLGPNSSIIARALAFADIGSGGMDGPEEAQRDSREYFLELHPAIARRLQEKPIHPREYPAMRKMILEWNASQLGFVEGRRARMDDELEGLPENAIKALKSQVFTQFENTLSGAEVLLEDMGKASDEVLSNWMYRAA